jgi:hypothetical protein
MRNQINKKTNRYNHFNPWGGESLLVFKDPGAADGQDSGVQLDQNDKFLKEFVLPQFAQAQAEETALVKEVREMLPARVEYDPMKQDSIQSDWESVLKEYNGVQTYVTHFTKLRDKVASDGFDEFLQNERWQARFQQIYANFNLKALRRLNLSPEVLASIEAKKNEEVSFIQSEVVNDLNNIRAQLLLERQQLLGVLEDRMKNDFKMRLDYIRKEWTQNPPKGFEPEHIANQVAFLDQVQSALKGVTPLAPKNIEFESADQNLDEYKKVWEDVTRMEDRYLMAKEDENTEFSLVTLEKEYKEAEAFKKSELDPIADAYHAKTNEAIAELEALMAEISSLPGDKIIEKDGKPIKIEGKITEREETLKVLGKALAKLKGGLDMSNALNNALSTPDVYETDDPENPGQKKAVEWELNGQKFPLHKGIRESIDFLKVAPLNQMERQAMARGIHESLAMFKNHIVEVQENFTNGFAIIKEKIELLKKQKEPSNPPDGAFTWNWVALGDVQRAVEIIQEWGKRRYQRVATMRVGNFGSQVLSKFKDAPWPLTPLRSLPNEFNKEVENAEKNEVQHYKDIYANKDMWQVWDIVINTKNKDEFKACLFLLSDNGRIRWESPDLIRQFNYFQSNVNIPTDINVSLANMSALYAKIRIAIGNMWDFDTFNGMMNTNSSSYQSKKSQYDQDCNRWAEMEGGLTKVISGLLVEAEAIPPGKVDPILYEKIIDYAVNAGKMDAESKLFFLIKGIGCGLLSSDRGSVLNSTYINNYPAIDYFGSPTARAERPTLADIQEVAALDYAGFLEWFHTKCMTLEKITQRVDKTLTQGNRLDHDDLTAYLGWMGETTTETMLKSLADGFRLPLTGVQNGTTSMVNMLDTFAEHPDMPRAKEQLQRFIGSFTRYDGITTDKMYTGDKNYFHFDSTSYNQKPRTTDAYAEVYGRSGYSCADNMATVRKHLRLLDNDFFGALYDGSIHNNRQAMELVRRMEKKYGASAKELFEQEFDPKARDEAKDVKDRLYQSAGAFSGWLIKNRPNQIEAMYQSVREEHDTLYSQMRAKGKTVLAGVQKFRKPAPGAANSNWHFENRAAA